MNKYYLFILLIVIFISCNSKKASDLKSHLVQSEADVKKVANEAVSKLRFLDKTTYSFGKINSDTIIKKKFFFVNESEIPLLILDSHSSCNCTELLLSNKIVMSKDTAYIELTMDAQRKHGYTRIYGTIITNTFQKYYKVSLIGEVNSIN